MVNKDEVYSFHCQTDEKIIVLLKANNNEMVELLDFGDGKDPTRFFLCSEADFEEAMSIKGGMVGFSFRNINYISIVSTDSNSLLPGVCISMWLQTDAIKNRFDLEDAQMIQDRWGSWFGGRVRVPSQGTYGYLGPKYSTRARVLSPTTGPGTVVISSYFRQHYNQDHFQPYLQAKIYEAARDAKELINRMYPTYNTFVGLNTGDRVIWTQGRSHRNTTSLTRAGLIVTRITEARDAPMGFYNLPHYDKGDKMPAVEKTKWFNVLMMRTRMRTAETAARTETAGGTKTAETKTMDLQVRMNYHGATTSHCWRPTLKNTDTQTHPYIHRILVSGYMVNEDSIGGWLRSWNTL
jgi:hypothetical protein